MPKIRRRTREQQKLIDVDEILDPVTGFKELEDFYTNSDIEAIAADEDYGKWMNATV